MVMNFLRILRQGSLIVSQDMFQAAFAANLWTDTPIKKFIVTAILGIYQVCVCMRVCLQVCVYNVSELVFTEMLIVLRSLSKEVLK